MASVNDDDNKSSEFKLWGDKQVEATNETLIKLNNSLDVDKRLFNEDIDGSQAYASAIADVGIITADELHRIRRGLEQVRQMWQQDLIKFNAGDEDVHTVNERLLTEMIGAAGAKLHTGRSRNDQVAVDVKLWLRTAIKQVQRKLISVIDGVQLSATNHVDVLMPGYTHLQRAQAVRFSHWIMSYGFYLKMDFVRFENLLNEVNNAMPLGSGAIAGNPFGIDRIKLAHELGFTGVTQNSMFAVGDRDYIVDFLYNCSMVGQHLSRLSEDLILYCSKEFGFFTLSEAFTTGSSLMPQKRNPDSLELVRGTTGVLLGNLTGFMATLKGLPSTYNKDLQYDKKLLFESFDYLITCLSVIEGVVHSLKVNAKSCRAALSFDMLATDVAYYLVRKGVPFRKAHQISSEVVSYANEKGVQINKVSLEQLKKISPHFNETIATVWDFESSVEQYTVIGGTSMHSVNDQLTNLREFISNNRENVESSNIN